MSRQRKSIGPSRLLAASLLFCLAAGWTAAQQTSEGRDERPATVLRVTTRLVTVDVVVTDKKGRPVTDLARGDFTVLENGRPQALAAFSFERPGLRAAEQPAPPPLPPDVYTNRPEYTLPPGPLTILLLDTLNTPVLDQAYARQQLLRYLSTQVKPEQRTAVFALGNRLLLLQDFTSDSRLLQAALEKYVGRKSVELSLEEPDPPVPGEILDVMPAQALASLQAFEQDRVAAAISSRGTKTLGALQAIARAMAGYPGRKNLIWVSAAFPFRLMPGNLGDTRSQSNELQRTANALTDAQVAVYPVDARGLVGYPMADASDPQRRGFDPLGGSSFGGELSARTAALAASFQTMHQVAHDTGGLVFHNRNDIDVAVDLSVADGSTYYGLAYYPEKKDWDGKFRRIEVKVNRPGLEVRHRRGYYAIDPTQQPREPKIRAHDVMAALIDPLPASVITFEAYVPPPAAGSPGEVVIHFRVDAHTVTSEETREGRRYDLDFVIGAFIPDGTRIKATTQRVRTVLGAEGQASARAEGLAYTMKVPLEPGRYRLRLLVRDNRTGLLGTTDVPLLIASP